jgi:uncharacterized protein YegP (UPF0339 family)
MKKNENDQYDFDQISPSSQPGFEVFLSEKHNLWFFHCNDVHGNPVLFSQAYAQKEAAKKGLTSTLNNLEKNRIYLEGQDCAWYFIILANNRQEVARSRFFETKEDAEQHTQFLKQVGNSNNPMAQENTKIVNTENLIQPLELEAVTTPSLRYSFRLLFYKNDIENNEFTGRIEDINTNKIRIFKGVDRRAIAEFLAENMPDFNSLIQNEPIVAETTTTTHVSKPSFITTSITQKATERLDAAQLINHQNSQPINQSISQQTNNQPTTITGKLEFALGNKAIVSQKSQTIEMRLSSTNNTILPDVFSIMGAWITLKGMENSEELNIPINNFILEGSSQIVLQIPADKMTKAGTYQLCASAWLKSNSANPSAFSTMYNLTGTNWMYIV